MFAKTLSPYITTWLYLKILRHFLGERPKTTFNKTQQVILIYTELFIETLGLDFHIITVNRQNGKNEP